MIFLNKGGHIAHVFWYDKRDINVSFIYQVMDAYILKIKYNKILSYWNNHFINVMWFQILFIQKKNVHMGMGMI